MLKKISTLISVAAIITVIGCAPKSGSQMKKDTVVKTEQKTVVKLKVTPINGKVAVGTIMEFKVVGLDAAGKTIPLSADWKLTGGKTVVGILNNTRGNEITFTAKTPGNVTLEAEYNKLKATAAIEVVKKK